MTIGLITLDEIITASIILTCQWGQDQKMTLSCLRQRTLKPGENNKHNQLWKGNQSAGIQTLQDVAMPTVGRTSECGDSLSEVLTHFALTK
jgi:hypothetical protein